MSVLSTIRLKYTSDYPLRYGANAAAEFDDPSWPRFVRITDVTSNGNLRDDTFRSLPPEIANEYLLDDGDILLARSGATVGKSFIYDKSWGQACYAGYLIRSRTADRYCARFIYWFLQSQDYWSEINSNLIQSTIQNFSAEKYANIRVPSPHLDTQKRIAAFLDEKTEQIDALIEKKQALLERLAEKRQAIITQAVTKGLNPTAAMKHSRIDWLGEIPAHWEVKRLKFETSKIGSGVTPRGGASVYVNEGVMLLRSQNIHFDVLSLDDVVYIDADTDRDMSETRVMPNDVLLNITGASIGRCCVFKRTDARANVNQHVCIIRCVRSILPDFLNLYLSSSVGQLQIDLSQNGASREGLNFADLGAFRVLMPPLNEQEEIGAYIIERVEHLNLQNMRIEKSIKTLTEYRSALITTAVTGQMEI